MNPTVRRSKAHPETFTTKRLTPTLNSAPPHIYAGSQISIKTHTGGGTPAYLCSLVHGYVGTRLHYHEPPLHRLRDEYA